LRQIKASAPAGDVGSCKLFVRDLSYNTTHDGLHQGFSEFGEIQEAVIILDKLTGKSRGYGFVTFKSPEAAAKALARGNTKILDGSRSTLALFCWLEYLILTLDAVLHGAGREVKYHLAALGNPNKRQRDDGYGRGGGGGGYGGGGGRYGGGGGGYGGGGFGGRGGGGGYGGGGGGHHHGHGGYAGYDSYDYDYRRAGGDQYGGYGDYDAYGAAPHASSYVPMTGGGGGQGGMPQSQPPQQQQQQPRASAPGGPPLAPGGPTAQPGADRGGGYGNADPYYDQQRYY